MSGCCQPRAYERMFGAKQARLDADRYRKHGLRGTSRDLVELLSAGAERATNVELSGEYEEEAAKLLVERGLVDRVDRRVADFVAEPVEPHDVVVMHRVVCCYPDVDKLMGVAAANTRRRLVLTYPRERPWTRAGVGTINFFLRISGSEFRAFVHPVARMRAAAEREGLALERLERPGVIWENAAYERLPSVGDGNGHGMEPRHQDFAAEEVAIDRENVGEEEDDRTGADSVDDTTPAEDDTGYDAEIEDSSQL